MALRAAGKPRQDPAVVVTGIGSAGDLIALAEDLQHACLERRITVAVAESCTGGLVSAVITEIAGSSGYFLGGVVSYANEAKESLLDVPSDLIARHGAVSPEVAAAMASGVRARFDTDLSVSVTGIAGPDGGSIEKPVGLVYIAIATADGVQTLEERFAGDRATVRRSAAARALRLLHGTALEIKP